MVSKFFLSSIFWCLLQVPAMLYAQYNIAELGVAQGQFKANELSMATNLTGLHFAIELPLATYSTRFGLDYLTRIGADTTGNSINKLTTIKLMGGKVFNNGHRVQFPLLAGGYAMTPVGDLRFEGEKKSVYGLSAVAGLRVYVSNRFSIFGEALYDVGLLSNYSYTNKSGAAVKSNVPINVLSFSVGVAFVYFNKEKK